MGQPECTCHTQREMVTKREREEDIEPQLYVV